MKKSTKKNKHFFSIFKKLHSSFIILLMLFLLIPSTYGQYVHTDKTRIVDANGEDLYFYGMNLGNWLLWEGYLMMGDFNYRTHTQFLNSMSTAFGNDMNKAREFEHQWRLNYVTENAINELKELGFNSVRVPFHYNIFWDGSDVTDHGFQYLDRLIEFCKANDMYILLDMHAAPGYQNPGDHSDNLNSNSSQPRESVEFWDNNDYYINIASAVWRHIADYYKNEPTIWGYDLINEPVPQPGREFELLGSLIKLRNAIREVDNNHIIVAEGSWWGSDMQKLDWLDTETQNQSGISTRWDDNMVYQTHHYSHDVSQLDGRLAICNKLEVPLILGEYGESDMYNLRNMTDWCIENNVDYFPWSFKKMSHDKCLWTIEPNNAYNQLKNAISSNTVGPSSLYTNMISFCQNNIANSSPDLVWHQDFYEAVKPNTPPCIVDIPGNFTASNISTNSIELKWDDATNEQGYTISCSNGQSVEISADTTNYTFVGLSEFTLYTFSISSFNNECSSTEIVIEAKTLCSGTQTPYQGIAIPIPGIIEAENYDEGCNAFNEFSIGNSGGEYRNGDVDITTGSNGSYAIGWIEDGEWLEYTVNIQQTGSYKIDYLVASPVNTGQIELQIAEATIATMPVPNTGDWNNYLTASARNVELDSGIQVIRINFIGGFNLDKLDFQIQDEPSHLQSITITPSSDTIYVGESLDFMAEGFDQYGEKYILSESWTASGGEIDTNGTFIASSTGTFTITASDQGLSDSSSILVIEAPQCIPNIPGKFEAEEYSNMSGIQTENTSDIGAGLNVGWIDSGDWMEYSGICVEKYGVYNIELRIASENNGGQVEIQDQNNSVLTTINVPKTGGWQNWITINESITLSNSITTLKAVVTQGGFNINWFSFSLNDNSEVNVDGVSLSSTSISLSINESLKLTETVSPLNASNKTVSWNSESPSVATVNNGLVTAISEGSAIITATTTNGGYVATCQVEVTAESPLILIQAQDYIDMSGIQTENTLDDNGEMNVGWIDDGDWMSYSINLPASGEYLIEYRIASLNNGGQLQLEKLGGENIYGTIDIPSTGGWQEWSTISHNVNLNSGQQEIAIAAIKGGWNINWLKISQPSLKSATNIHPNNKVIKSYSVYPNPATDRIYIKGLNEHVLLEILNLAGTNLTDHYGNYADISDLKPGIYILRFNVNGSSNHIKFIKK